MPEAIEYFSELKEKSEYELKDIRETIMESANGDFESLSDELLAKLFAVTRFIRQKTSAGTRKRGAPKVKKSEVIDDIL